MYLVLKPATKHLYPTATHTQKTRYYGDYTNFPDILGVTIGGHIH